ncbi:hypothetical protein ABZ912_57095 [Nonomuraea angiospora]|uniref:GHMP family kinase ATP-binding protein n=1 Tax=Nonomuraea angiospora TaxID=46172 RepID=UPI0034065A41
MNSTVTGQRVATSTAFGTFGELLQGRLQPGNRDFLVTLPIARRSTAVFEWRPGEPLRVDPPGKRKAWQLIRRMLRLYGYPPEGVLTLTSELPEGKGMASSSADMVATARAVALALGVSMPPATIEDLIRSIEPTDGVMYDGVTAFYHREVRLCAWLGRLPKLLIVGVDEGGTTDTVSYNRIPKRFTREDSLEYRLLLGRLSVAVRKGDLPTVGQVATCSSIMNQRFHHKRLLPQMLDICRTMGGLGVVVAHSGTKLGILLHAGTPDHDERLDSISRACRALTGTTTLDWTLE